MAETTPDTTTSGTAPKGKKGSGSIMKKKVAGIPMPVILIGGGIVAYLLYRHFTSSAAASTSSTATPTSSSGTTSAANGLSGGVSPVNGLSGGVSPVNGLSGGTSPVNGLSGGASGGGGYSPSYPWTPTGTKPTTAAKKAIKPIGKKVVSVAGKSFSTVSGFMQGGNTYYGINNPAEAKRLEALGVNLVHNPNDPSSTALFIMKPAGSVGIPVHHPQPANNGPVATGSQTGTGLDYAGTGSSGSRGTPSQIRAANERRAANVKAANERRATNRKRAAAQHKLPVATIANRRSGKP